MNLIIMKRTYRTCFQVVIKPCVVFSHAILVSVCVCLEFFAFLLPAAINLAMIYTQVRQLTLLLERRNPILAYEEGTVYTSAPLKHEQMRWPSDLLDQKRVSLAIQIVNQPELYGMDEMGRYPHTLTYPWMLNLLARHSRNLWSFDRKYNWRGYEVETSRSERKEERETLNTFECD